MRQAFANTIYEIGQSDDALVVLVGDISHGILKPFAKESPDRFYNVGILEPTIVSMAAGLSHVGFHPVAHTIAPFLVERCLEQIKLDFCYQDLGGNFVSVGSAFDYSGLGCSHHCYTDIALIKGLPNTQIIYPAMPDEFKILFRQTYKNNQLTYFRLPAKKHGISIEAKEIIFGKGLKLREGNDITLLGIGPQIKTIIEASEMLKTKNISTEVLYYHTIKPFDRGLLVNSMEKTRAIIVVEEHCQYGGISEDVLSLSSGLGNIYHSFINIPNVFSRGYGSYEEHCKYLGFTAANIIKEVEKAVSWKRVHKNLAS